MSSNKLLFPILLLIACVSLSACMKTQTKHSYFGEHQQKFRPGPEGGVDRIWTPEHIKSRKDINEALKPYKSIIVDPILVSFKDKEAFDGLNPTELKALTDEFRTTIVSTLSGHYAVVSEPGPKVLRLNLALTGVETTNSVLALTSTITPIGLAISTFSKVITGEHTNVGSASMEATLTDSITKKGIFAVIDRHAGRKDLKKIVDSSSDAKKAFKWWAERLKNTLLNQELS